MKLQARFHRVAQRVVLGTRRKASPGGGDGTRKAQGYGSGTYELATDDQEEGCSLRLVGVK